MSTQDFATAISILFGEFAKYYFVGYIIIS
jgi:hypothetical protein